LHDATFKHLGALCWQNICNHQSLQHLVPVLHAGKLITMVNDVAVTNNTQGYCAWAICQQHFQEATIIKLLINQVFIYLLGSGKGQLPCNAREIKTTSNTEKKTEMVPIMFLRAIWHIQVIHQILLSTIVIFCNIMKLTEDDNTNEECQNTNSCLLNHQLVSEGLDNTSNNENSWESLHPKGTFPWLTNKIVFLLWQQKLFYWPFHCNIFSYEKNHYRWCRISWKGKISSSVMKNIMFQLIINNNGGHLSQKVLDNKSSAVALLMTIEFMDKSNTILLSTTLMLEPLFIFPSNQDSNQRIPLSLSKVLTL